MNRPIVHALIAAGGKGTRLGGSIIKQYLPLAGKPVLVRALEAINLYPEIAGVTVVIAPDDALFDDVIDTDREGVEKVIGGETRAESVMNGLQSIRQRHPETEWVMVHDAARPCVPRDCLETLLTKGLASDDGAILAIPVGDTLKRADDEGRIGETVNRKGLWAAQTPQLFPFDRLCTTLQAALAAGDAPTDEAGVMEHAGARPLLVMGSAANIKITNPGDVAVAESWLLSQQPVNE